MTDVASLPPLQGIHHLKLAVTDLDRSLSFYQELFGAKRIPQGGPQAGVRWRVVRIHTGRSESRFKVGTAP